MRATTLMAFVEAAEPLTIPQVFERVDISYVRVRSAVRTMASANLVCETGDRIFDGKRGRPPALYALTDEGLELASYLRPQLAVEVEESRVEEGPEQEPEPEPVDVLACWSALLGLDEDLGDPAPTPSPIRPQGSHSSSKRHASGQPLVRVLSRVGG